MAMESVHFLFNYRRLSNRRSGTSIGGPRGALNAACGGCGQIAFTLELTAAADGFGEQRLIGIRPPLHRG